MFGLESISQLHRGEDTSATHKYAISCFGGSEEGVLNAMVVAKVRTV